MENHPIPQDVTGFKFRLIGSMTVKQFLYVLGGGILAIAFYSMPISAFIKIPLALLCGGMGAAIAFVPIEGRPMDIMIKNFLKALPAENRFVYRKKGAENLITTYFSPPKIVKVVEVKDVAQEELERKRNLLRRELKIRSRYKPEPQETAVLSGINKYFNEPDSGKDRNKGLTMEPIAADMAPKNDEVPQKAEDKEKETQEEGFDKEMLKVAMPPITNADALPEKKLESTEIPLPVPAPVQKSADLIPKSESQLLDTSIKDEESNAIEGLKKDAQTQEATQNIEPSEKDNNLEIKQSEEDLSKPFQPSQTGETKPQKEDILPAAELKRETPASIKEETPDLAFEKAAEIVQQQVKAQPPAPPATETKKTEEKPINDQLFIKEKDASNVSETQKAQPFRPAAPVVQPPAPDIAPKPTEVDIKATQSAVIKEKPVQIPEVMPEIKTQSLQINLSAPGKQEPEKPEGQFEPLGSLHPLRPKPAPEISVEQEKKQTETQTKLIEEEKPKTGDYEKREQNPKAQTQPPHSFVQEQRVDEKKPHHQEGLAPEKQLHPVVTAKQNTVPENQPLYEKAPHLSQQTALPKKLPEQPQLKEGQELFTQKQVEPKPQEAHPQHAPQPIKELSRVEHAVAPQPKPEEQKPVPAEQATQTPVKAPIPTIQANQPSTINAESLKIVVEQPQSAIISDLQAQIDKLRQAQGQVQVITEPAAPKSETPTTTQPASLTQQAQPQSSQQQADTPKLDTVPFKSPGINADAAFQKALDEIKAFQNAPMEPVKSVEPSVIPKSSPPPHDEALPKADKNPVPEEARAPINPVDFSKKEETVLPINVSQAEPGKDEKTTITTFRPPADGETTSKPVPKPFIPPPVKKEFLTVKPNESTSVKSVGQSDQLNAGFPILPDVPNIVLGIVKDPRGRVLPNMLVEIFNSQGIPARAFKTNGLGQFIAATPLSNGEYNLVIDDPRKTNEFENIHITLDGKIFQPLEISSVDAREKLRRELFGGQQTQAAQQAA